MKNLLFSFSLFFLGNLLFSQNLGLHFTPNLSKAFLNNHINNKNTISFGVGLSYEQEIFKRNKIEVGLHHTQLSSKFDQFVCLFPSPFFCPSKIVYRYNYIETPLSFKTRLGKQKESLNTFLVTGYSYSFYLGTKSISFSETERAFTSRTHDDFEKNLHNVNLGLEFIKKFRNKFSLSVSPVYSLSFINKNIYQQNIKTFKLDFKLSYSLKKDSQLPTETQF